MQDFGGVAHEHSQTGRSATSTTHPVGAGDVARDRGELVGDLREFLVDTKQLLGVGLSGWKKFTGCWPLLTQRVVDRVPALPRVQVVAVLVFGDAVIVDDHLRSGGDGHVVDEGAQCSIGGVTDVGEDVRQSVADDSAGHFLEGGDIVIRTFPERW